VKRFSIGLAGGRGHVGGELLRLIGGHPELELRLATSSEVAGRTVRDVVGAAIDVPFEAPSPVAAAERKLDVLVLGLANGESGAWVRAFLERSPETALVDLSADYRFDDAWVYGQPERRRSTLRYAKRIANPGCYATAAQLAVDPFVSVTGGPITVFGVSGYSGAGATPSPRNDPEKLKDSVMPYSLVDHTHERELRRVLGTELDFLPHVAPFFRGLSVTVSMRLREPSDRKELVRRLEDRYEREPMVQVSNDAPLAREAVGRHDVMVGGVDVSKDGRRAVVVAALDNLLAGAASQALRNVNLALGLDELTGIPR